MSPSFSSPGLSAPPVAPSATGTSARAASRTAFPTTGGIPAGPVGPTSAELLDFVRRTAGDEVLVSLLPLDPRVRTWLRLEGPYGSEGWLIGWPPGTGTGWHDHGGSQGAFATASGRLTEHSPSQPPPTDGRPVLEIGEGGHRQRELAVGDARAFGTHHVHEVVNPAHHGHAISVHVYHPPLPLMRRYSRHGRLLRLEEIEQPREWS